MSAAVAIAYNYAEQPRVLEASRPPADLCERIYLRNYTAHQAAQVAISQDWYRLLAPQ